MSIKLKIQDTNQPNRTDTESLQEGDVFSYRMTSPAFVVLAVQDDLVCMDLKTKEISIVVRSSAVVYFRGKLKTSIDVTGTQQSNQFSLPGVL